MGSFGLLWFALTVVRLSQVDGNEDSNSTSSKGHEWTYRGTLGPDYWHLEFAHCGGVKQSPITIVTDDVIVDASWLKPFHFKGYDEVANVNMTLENNGHTVQVDLNNHGIEITGGGLHGPYVAEQFHFHWGSVDARGSEHDINGQHFPMEMHIVHFRKEHGSVGIAADKEDGLAVLAFFFVVGRYNEHFEAIIENFMSIQHKGETYISPTPLRELIPAHLARYYRYSGSLTTPPCYESVIWTIFNETIEIAEEQLEDFRTKILESKEDSVLDISDDFRPPQCLNRRRIYASHHSLKYSLQPGSYDVGQTRAQTMDGVERITIKLCTIVLCVVASVISYFC